MSVNLIIIGAGGSSRDIAEAIASSDPEKKNWNLLGFLDDDAAKQGTIVDGIPVLGVLDSVSTYPDAKVLIGVAGYQESSTRKNLVQRLGLPDERYTTFVHPSAFLSPSAKIGLGVAVLQNVVISSSATIGSHVLLSPGTAIGHDAVVHDYVVLAAEALVCGNVAIHECAFIGARSVLSPATVVGAGVLVGIGAVVVQDVEPGATVFGNPARALNTAGRQHRWRPAPKRQPCLPGDQIHTAG